jgi:hypothetical protein
MEECGNCEEHIGLPQYWIMNDVKNAMPPEASLPVRYCNPYRFRLTIITWHEVDTTNLRRDDESNKIGKLKIGKLSREVKGRAGR